MTVEEVARRIGLSRQALGAIERHDQRAGPPIQERLVVLFERPIDELFEPANDRIFELGPRGDRIGLTAAGAKLGLTKEGVRTLPAHVKAKIRLYDDPRHPYSATACEALVAPGSVRLSTLAHRLRELASGLGLPPPSQETLWRKCKTGTIRAVRPWPEAREYRVPAAEVARLEEELRAAAKRPKRGRQKGAVPEQLRPWMETPEWAETLAKGRDDYFRARRESSDRIDAEIVKRDGLDLEAAAAEMKVSTKSVEYCRDVSFTLTGDWIIEEATLSNGKVVEFSKWYTTLEQIKEHRRIVAALLPPAEEWGSGDQQQLGKHGVRLVEAKYLNNERGKGNIEEGSPEEETASQRVRQRRKDILTIAARKAASRSGGSKRGLKEAKEAIRCATEVITEKPWLRKKDLSDRAMIAWLTALALAKIGDPDKAKKVGLDAVFDEQGTRRGSRDPIYRKRRAAFDRALRHGFKKWGVPPELEHLFGTISDAA